MVPTSDSSAHLQEARIAVESAIAVAAVVAQNEIVECQSFNQMVVFLHDAIEALAKAEGEPLKPQHTIFPTQEAANDYLADVRQARMLPIGFLALAMENAWCRFSGWRGCFRRHSCVRRTTPMTITTVSLENLSRIRAAPRMPRDAARCLSSTADCLHRRS
jgi:hypothetical protein